MTPLVSPKIGGIPPTEEGGTRNREPLDSKFVRNLFHSAISTRKFEDSAFPFSLSRRFDLAGLELCRNVESRSEEDPGTPWPYPALELGDPLDALLRSKLSGDFFVVGWKSRTAKARSRSLMDFREGWPDVGLCSIYGSGTL